MMTVSWVKELSETRLPECSVPFESTKEMMVVVSKPAPATVRIASAEAPWRSGVTLLRNMPEVVACSV